jgi:hypothetical protein
MIDAFALVDKIVFSKIIPAASEKDIETINIAAMDTRDPNGTTYREFIYRMMDALDNKTSALLTHISLIIAALIFIYTFDGAGKLLKFVVMSEVCAYLILTIFCIRSIRMTTRLSDGKAATEVNALAIELYKRRALYNFSSNVTIFVTLLTIITFGIAELVSIIF